MKRQRNRPRAQRLWIAALPILLAAAWLQARADEVPDAVADARLEATINDGSYLVRDAEVDAHLAAIVARLQAANPDAATPPVRIHALRYSLPYGLSLGNGAVYVATGTIARLDDVSELAALVAAELTAERRVHEQLRHFEAHDARWRRWFPDLFENRDVNGDKVTHIVMNEDKQVLTAKQTQADQDAIQWLQRAGYDPQSLVRGLQRLHEAMLSEQHQQESWSTDSAAWLADPAALAGRIRALQALPVKDAPAVPLAPTEVEQRWFIALAHTWTMQLAAEELSRGRGLQLQALLDRNDVREGPTADAAILRADNLRRTRTDTASLADVIAAYAAVLKLPGPPLRTYRELGFLSRRQGDETQARAYFQKYLELSPDAADAPIIRSYLENP
jgi:beta-barrel assembly-enhancing protease